MQAGLGHEGQQPHGFQRDGLAAGVGAGDDHGEGLLVEVHINGHHFFSVQQRVARLKEAQRGAGVVAARFGCVQHRFRGAQVVGVFGAHQRQVHLGQRAQHDLNLPRLAADLRGNIRQNTAHLVALGQLHFVQFVVQLHRDQRLHKQGRA